MKGLLLTEDTIVNKVSYYHLALFLIALPYDFFYSELILVSFGIHTLIHAVKEDYARVFSKRVAIPASLFFLSLLAVTYSPDKGEGFNVVTKQLAILLFPVLFALNRVDLEKIRMPLFKIFGSACAVTILYLFVDAARTVLNFGLPVSSLLTTDFMNHAFALPIGIHATYLSMYVAFSLLFFLYLLIRKEDPNLKWWYILASAILFAGLVQLSSRAVFIAFLCILNLVFPFFLLKGKRKWIVFVLATFLSAAALAVILNVDSFKMRYVSELKTDLTNKPMIIENIEPRLARWSAIMDLVKGSPLVGYGTGSEKRLLQDKYYRSGLYISYLSEFNTHSEYLSLLIKSGVIGLFLFLYILFQGSIAAIHKGDLLFLSFLILITITSVSENILDLNKGIFFYSFFISFFMWKKGLALKKEITTTIGLTGNRPFLKSV